jgi:nucleoside-diphosphate-sugar epimerase
MNSNPSSPTVLVTGATGFIAMHCILQLLEHGYRVRATLRSLARETRLRQIFMQHTDVGDRLEFAVTDLLKDEGWNDALSGCEYVVHVASPFPLESPKDENELLAPARDGTQRVLRASANNGIKRVVLTSSSVAISRGHKDCNKTFDENDWSNLHGNISSYAKSKTLAERAAWEFVNQQAGHQQIELSVINPGLVLGPLLDGEFFGTSAIIIKRILAGEDQGDFRNRIELVDARDVASAHLAAMTKPVAAGKRYCCVSDVLWRQEVLNILSQHFSGRGYEIQTQEISDFADELNAQYRFSSERIVHELGWQPRSAEEALVSMGKSLIRYGVV